MPSLKLHLCSHRYMFKEKQREARTNQETMSLHSALCTHICRPACCGMDQLDVPTTNCPYLTASYMILPCTADPIIPIKGGGGNVLARLGPLHDLLVAQ